MNEYIAQHDAPSNALSMAMPNDGATPARDLAQAEAFLRLLDPTASGFTFQIIHDGKGGQNTKPAGLLHGTFEKHGPALERLNDAGRSIFVAINKTNLKGRKTDDIVKVRAIFIDADTPEAVAKVEAAVALSGLQPGCIVRTSPGKAHYYWLVDDLPLGEFTAFQQAMIDRLGTDPSVKDLPRVMRMPGFLHQKGHPHLVELTYLDKTRRIYGREELVRGFGLDLRGDARSARTMPQDVALPALGVPSPMFQGIAPEVANDLVAGVAACTLDLDLIRSAMLALSLADEGQWKLATMALAHAAVEHLEHEDALYAILDEISRQPGAGNYDEAENRKHFERFVADTPAKLARGEKVVTLGTIFDAAEKAGWVRPSEAVAVPPMAALQTADIAFPVLDVAHAPGVPTKRRWLYGNDLARGYVTLLAAPGGAGKTALAVGMAVSLATGRSLLCDWVHSRMRVLLVNGEDSSNEMMLRVHAAAQQHKLDVAKDLGGHLHVLGADVARLRVVTIDPRTRMPVIDQGGVAKLEVTLNATRPDVLMLDPLVRLSEASENDAGAADMLMGELSRIAVRHGLSVLALHHNRKGASAETDGADAARGSTAITAAARVSLGLTKLRGAEAMQIGIMPEEAWRYFSIDTTKANLAPIGERRWRQLVSVTVPNADPGAGYPDGDSVQVVVPYQPQPVTGLIDDRMRHAACAVIHRGIPDPAGGMALPLSIAPQAARYAVPHIAAVLAPLMNPASAEHMAKEVLGDLLKSGFVTKENISIPKQGGKTNLRGGLVVHWGRTPWLAPLSTTIPGVDAPAAPKASAAPPTGVS